MDLICLKGRELLAIEIKSSATFSTSLLNALKKMKAISKSVTECFLIFNGNKKVLATDIKVIRFDEVDRIFS